MEFNVNDTVLLPKYIIEKFIDSYWIVVAPDYPNWIILNDIEHTMFKYIKSNTILGALKSFYNETKLSEEECLVIVKNLLTKINNSDFYLNSEIHKEETIETIPKRIHINITNNCNMRCSHCFMSAGLNPIDELNVENLIMNQ